MSQEPLDCERVSLGGVEPGGKRMPAPVGGSIGHINLPHNSLKIRSVQGRGYGFAILVTDDRLTAALHPFHEIRPDFCMNRHDPIFACICFQDALQVSAVLRMVGKTGKLQKFRYSEAGVTKHKGRICPRETAVGNAGQLSNLEIIQCVAGPLCAYGRNIQILGIVLIFRDRKSVV